MKRLHSLIQLGRTQPGLESNGDDAAVVNQPIEGQPTVEPTSEVLTAEQQAEAERLKADNATPTDGSIPAAEVPGVSQESGEAGVVAPVATETKPALDGVVDTGDGSQPATASDTVGDPAGRADIGQSVSTESEEAGKAAPVASETQPTPNKTVDTGDGSIPATPSDAAGDPEKRADKPQSGEGKPAELAPELEQKEVKAPQVTEVAADPNNPDNDNKDGGKADPVETTGTDKSAIEGGATPESTTTGEAVSQEDLSPAEIGQVAEIAAAAGAAAAGTNGEPAAVDAAATAAVAEVNDGAAVSGSDGAGVIPPVEVPVGEAGTGTPAATDDAAQVAADTVAAGPTGDTPPGPNAGDAAATPAEAAQVVADLIKANPETAAEVAQAIDSVADAAVSTTQGTEPPSAEETANGEAQAAAADAAAATQQEAGTAAEEEAAAAAEAELAESKDDMDSDDDDLDDMDDLDDDVQASQESMVGAIVLLSSLESIVVTALQNGGLSDDAAQMLQTVTDQVAEEQGLDETDLGLESLPYADRKNATHYALDRLHSTRVSLESELNVSTEGFFDLFRSFESKTKDWVRSSTRAIQAAKSTIRDKSKTANVEVAGTAGDYAQVVKGTQETLLSVFGPFRNTVIGATGELSRLSADLADGDNNWDDAVDRINQVKIAYPAGFTEMPERGMDDGKSTHDLHGGFKLGLNLDNSDSDSQMFKSKDYHRVDITGSDALNALNAAEAVVKAIGEYVSSFNAVKKAAGDNSAVKVTGPAIIASMFGPFALLSADYRRLVYRQFTKKDPQLNKAAELHSGLDLLKDAVKGSRRFVEAVLTDARRVAG